MKQAFTLIELLIVVAIIGILAAIAVPNFLQAQTKARLANVHAGQKTFADLQMMYRLDHGSFFPAIMTHPAWQNKFLTTPVAYISSTAELKDPFQIKHGDEQTWDWTHGELHQDPVHSHTLYYELFANYPVWLEPIERNPEEAYLIISVGPDQAASVYQNGKFGGPIYDQTNGIISFGDVFRHGF